MKHDSNGRSNKCHPPNSPNTAPATQNDHPTSGRNWRKTAEMSFPMRGRSEHVPSMIRPWSETVPVSPQPATQQRLLFALRTSILYWKMQHFELRLSFQISPSTAPATQSDTSTSPSTAPTTKSDTWTSPSTAPTTKSDTWTSPSTAPATKSDTWPSPSTAPATKSNTWPSPSTAPTTKSDTWPSPSTAPATQNDSQAWSSSHMKRHFQWEEQQMSPSKLTKYCACHAKWPSNIWQKFAENSWNVISNARPIPSMIRAWSDHDPRPFPSVRNPPRNRGYFSRSGLAFCIGKCNISSSGYLSKFHQVLRLPRKVTLQLHQVLRLPRKVTLELHQVLRLPRKVTLELHQRLLFALRTSILYWKMQHYSAILLIDHYYYSAILLIYSAILLIDHYYYSAILLIDSTITQRFY